MQFVSGLPATGVLAASQREAPAELAKPSPARVVPATSHPLLASAVVQTHPTERSAASFRKRALLTADQKALLTGPPPAFAINLLQHLHETRNDPEPVIPPDGMRPAEADVTGANPPKDGASAPAVHGSAGALLALGAAPPARQKVRPDMADLADITPQGWPGSAGDALPKRQLDLAL